MNNFTELPNGYKEILKIDLQKNTKLAVLVNVMALIIGVVMLDSSAFRKYSDCCF